MSDKIEKYMVDDTKWFIPKWYKHARHFENIPESSLEEQPTVIVYLIARKACCEAQLYLETTGRPSTVFKFCDKHSK